MRKSSNSNGEDVYNRRSIASGYWVRTDSSHKLIFGQQSNQIRCAETLAPSCCLPVRTLQPRLKVCWWATVSEIHEPPSPFHQTRLSQLEHFTFGPRRQLSADSMLSSWVTAQSRFLQRCTSGLALCQRRNNQVTDQTVEAVARVHRRSTRRDCFHETLQRAQVIHRTHISRMIWL